MGGETADLGGRRVRRGSGRLHRGDAGDLGGAARLRVVLRLPPRVPARQPRRADL